MAACAATSVRSAVIRIAGTSRPSLAANALDGLDAEHAAVEMVIGKNDGRSERRIGQNFRYIVEVTRQADIGAPSRQQGLHGFEHAEIVVDDDQRLGDEIGPFVR